MSIPTSTRGATTPVGPLQGQEQGILQDPIYYRPVSHAPVFGIREFYDTLLRGKWLILAAIVLVTVPVTIYTLMQPSMYRASSLLLVETSDENLADVLPTDIGSSFFKSDRNLENELLVLRQSEALADSVGAVLAPLETVPGTQQAFTVNRNALGERIGNKAIGALLQTGVVSANLEGSDVDAIRVSAVSTVPAEAAYIANTYARAFVHRTRASKVASVSASRQFLEGQVSEQSGRLQELDGSVREFMTREGAVDLDEAASNLVAQLASLQSERDAALVDMRIKEATITQLETELNSIEPRLAEFVASGAAREIELAQERVAELGGRLETIYGRNPELRTAQTVPDDVERLRSEISQLNGRISQLTQQYLEEAVPVGAEGNSAAMERITSLRQQLATERIALSGLEAKVAVLGSRIGQYDAQMRALPRQSIGLAQLQRDRESTAGLYSALEERLNEARIAEESELGYAEMIRSASVPIAPFSPNRKRNVFMALLLGLCLGVALAIAKTRLDNRIHRPDDLRDLNYPVLGIIPSMTELVKQDFDGAETVVIGDQTLDTRLVTLLNPMAVASESYRALRTSIQFSRPDTVIETIIVTSGSPDEGKTVTSSNLAVAMAQAGRRVLLVEADLRRPSVHKMFGMRREPGLVQLLFDVESFAPENYATPIDNLYILPPGSHAVNPSELLGSKTMRDCMSKFRESFDIVIFDAPPILAATDAVLLSTQCDATVVVARAGNTKNYDLQHSHEALESVGAVVIGTVLNDFDVSKAYGYRYKYQYRYGNIYGYGHDAHSTEA